MTSSVSVKYDATTLSPTPIVNYSSQPVNFGYVYGYNTEISLDGFYTGISNTGAAISYLTGIFGNQFKALTVTDNLNNTLYSWSGVTVDSISLDTNSYFIGSMVKYSVKLKAFDFPSGVIDPSNEYAFSQNEDGTVSVSHKISARGVRGVNGAFSNAVSFVQQFTGKDPFSNCAPFFVPSGSGILASINENINRADSVYTVTESYRYSTGAFVPYVKTAALDINESIESEYRTIDYQIKFQGSPIKKNIDDILNSLSYNVPLEIQNDFGFNTSNWVKSSYSASVDSGSAVVEVKIGYLSGANPSGFFDYDIAYDYDRLTNIESWKVNGEFKCFGPIDYKLKQVQNFKAVNSANSWRNYLSGIVTSSPIYQNNHSASQAFSPNTRVSVSENTGLGTLKLSVDMVAGYEPTGIASLKYSMDVVPSRWIYEILGSATIEGSYVIQDLQTKTQAKQGFTFNCQSFNKDAAVDILTRYANSIANTYVNSGNGDNIKAFVIANNVITGTYDNSYSISWLGEDLGISSGILSLQSIGTSTDSVPVRESGFNFGY